MKKIALFLGMLLFSVTLSFGNSNDYRVDDSAIDALFSSASEVTISNLVNPDNPLLNAPKLNLDVHSDKNAVTAFVICWVLGGLGIHRVYLGTSTPVIVGYILTLGGCGIVWTIDWIVLLIAVLDKGDVGKYVDNPKFFMW
jgi:TM2 domain-containing membrane protein YozV